MITIVAADICVSTAAQAECVTVKYRNGARVPLEKLDCKAPQSSFVHQIRYDAKNQYMILLRDTWYPHFSMPAEKVKGLETAESVGRFYNEKVKGKIGCQGRPVPAY